MHARSARTTQVLAGVLLATALALTGCSGGSDSAGSTSDAAKLQAEPAQGVGQGPANADAANGTTAAPAPRAVSGIIRTASLTVQVKDVPKALDEARTVAEGAGGYVGRETTTRDPGGHERTRVVLRVPVAAYAEVLDDLEGSGKLLERTARAEDVTDQIVDVESRISTQRASVARIRELMDRATRLTDVVQLEGELSARQSDLEALLAQQASLKDRTSLATITVSLSETPVERAAEDDDPGFVDALSGGWDAFLTTLRWIALVLGAVLPFAAALGLLTLLWLRVVRPRLPRRAEPAPTAAVPGALPAFGMPRPAAGERPGEGGATGRATGGATGGDGQD
ncbi:DUF4349 domain-containing protein [Streptomyces sp. NPDC006458]|uniref:DUF4349 domain-containing protein n=1 Tax=Streptomyces sp. NPDC006458 TaxID=3154302 RepID=UPI0033BF746E